MNRADALAREAEARLAALARRPSGHPASGGFGTRLRRLGLTADEMRTISRELTRECHTFEPREVVRVAQAPVAGGCFEGELAVFDLLWRHRAAAASLTGRDLARLARGAGPRSPGVGRRAPRGGRA